MATADVFAKMVSINKQTCQQVAMHSKLDPGFFSPSVCFLANSKTFKYLRFFFYLNEKASKGTQDIQALSKEKCPSDFRLAYLRLEYSISFLAFTLK